MIRYIIQKHINADYCYGYITIMESQDKPKTFVSYDSALQWLIDNDEDFVNLPIIEVVKIYDIKPYIV